MQFGIAKKDRELSALRDSHTGTLQQISNESKRVLDKQRSRIIEFERNNVVLEKQLKRKSKKANR